MTETELELPASVENAVDAVAEPAMASKQKEIILALASGAELFHCPNGVGYADIKINGHRETLAIEGKSFRDWLLNRFFHTEHSSPNSEAMKSALNTLNASARFGGPERNVYVRVGGHCGRIYIDLADDLWRAVEIDSDGWRVVEAPPVRFRRAATMRALPLPETGGSVFALRDFLNVRDEDFPVVVGWLMGALRDRGPYPLLVISGEQGSAKSGLVRILKILIDPSAAPLRTPPRSEHELFISTRNSHILAFDNVSFLSNEQSDALCRLSTGGGYVVRELYSNDNEVVFEAMRPVVANGIEDFVTRADLADRAILLTLETIPEHKRRLESEIAADFRNAHPAILGALFDGVSEGLRRLPSIQMAQSPRMADFAAWGTACETQFWPAGTFMTAYSRNLSGAVENVIDADPVGSAVRLFVRGHSNWSGNATKLLSLLNSTVDEERFSNGWPKNAQMLSNRLRRATTPLRKAGIEVRFEREGHARERIIHLSVMTKSASIPSSAPSASSATWPEPEPLEPTEPNDDAILWDDAADDADGADAITEDESSGYSSSTVFKNAA